MDHYLIELDEAAWVLILELLDKGDDLHKAVAEEIRQAIGVLKEEWESV